MQVTPVAIPLTKTLLPLTPHTPDHRQDSPEGRFFGTNLSTAREPSEASWKRRISTTLASQRLSAVESNQVCHVSKLSRSSSTSSGKTSSRNAAGLPFSLE